MYERLRYACADLDKDIGMERPEAERFSPELKLKERFDTIYSYGQGP